MSSSIYVVQVYRNGSNRQTFPVFTGEVVETYADLQDAIDGTMELWMEEEKPTGFLLVDEYGKPLASMMPMEGRRDVAVITYASGDCTMRRFVE